MHICNPRTGEENCHPAAKIFSGGKIGAGMTEPQRDISELLVAWSNGDHEAITEVVAVVYPELRRIARRHLGRLGQPDHTLQSAAVANEVYLKLHRVQGIRCDNRAHFFALCAQMIRRILVDYARKHGYAKRGGDAVHVPLDEALLGTRARGIEMLALDEALVALSEMDPRKGRVVELRYFGGLTVEETADVLHISAETVLRDWKMAKAWLFSELRRTEVPPD
jgi:RNA polymerase sigma factor (TIGR02999 family)